jgi:hypothetical protein
MAIVFIPVNLCNRSHPLWSPCIIRVIKSRLRWVKHVAHVEGMRITFKILFVKPEGRRPFGRPSHRWENIINIKGKAWEVEDWIHLAQNTEQRRFP